MWNQTNTQAAQFQHTLKCKRELSYLQRSKLFQKGSRRASVSSPARLVQLAGLNTMMVATGGGGWLPRNIPECLERDASQACPVCICQTPTRNEGNLWKGRSVLSSDAACLRSPQSPLLVSLLSYSCPQLSGRWIRAWGSSSRGGGGRWHVFEPGLFLPWQPKQSVSSFCVAFV